MAAPYQDVYLGIDILMTDELRHNQTLLCKRLNLTPRAEFHLTVAYLGSVPANFVPALGERLKPVATDSLQRLSPSGTGGAYQEGTGSPQLIASLDRQYDSCRRVCWWSLKTTDALLLFRNSVVSACLAMGCPHDALNALFSPHVTIGSGQPDPQNQASWDVYTIPKGPSLQCSYIPHAFTGTRCHLTSSSVQPKSLFSIAEWPAR